MERINEYLNSNKIPVVLCLVGLVLVIGGVLNSNLLQKKEIIYPKESLVTNTSEIKADISGAVENPGVYTLTLDSRVDDLIKMSGGFAENSNQKYISKVINLSQKVSDGMKIYIPFDDEETGGVVAGVSNVSVSGKIGINSGTIEELNSLPAVGDVTSKKIINARPYSSLDELVTKKAISKTVLNKIKDLIDLH